MRTYTGGQITCYTALDTRILRLCQYRAIITPRRHRRRIPRLCSAARSRLASTVNRCVARQGATLSVSRELLIVTWGDTKLLESFLNFFRRSPQTSRTNNACFVVTSPLIPSLPRRFLRRAFTNPSRESSARVLFYRLYSATLLGRRVTRRDTRDARLASGESSSVASAARTRAQRHAEPLSTNSRTINSRIIVGANGQSRSSSEASLVRTISSNSKDAERRDSLFLPPSHPRGGGREPTIEEVEHTYR